MHTLVPIGVVVAPAVGWVVAALAMLFPAIFGGLSVLLRRWLPLLTVVCTVSTLFTLELWFGQYVRGYWWGTPGALGTATALVALLGVLWSWRRHLREEQAAGAASRTERWTVWVLSLAGLAAVLSFWIWNRDKAMASNPVWVFLLVLSVPFWVGTLHLLLRHYAAPRRVTLPTDGIILGAMVAVCVALNSGGSGATVAGGGEVLIEAVPAGERGPTKARKVWSFIPAGQSDVASSPVVAGDRVFIGIIEGNFFQRTGAVYCLDRATGKERWRFDDGGNMLQMFSTPCVADGKVYIGEGFHENVGCRLFCLDAATGKKLWEFRTTSHTESSPAVADGRVFFGAGDDGMYCLDAATGEKLWQYPDPSEARHGLHIDANPTVSGGRVYCCSGVSRTFQTLQVFCLDVKTGRRVWAVEDVGLPAWGSPVVDGGRLFVGLGNGRLTMSDPEPKGAVLCLDAFTGRRLWRFDEFGDAVHTRPAVDSDHVYVASRDGHCYCLDRRRGTLIWKHNLGSPSVSSPALARCSHCDAPTSLYVGAIGGMFYCLDPRTGEPFWKFGMELQKAAPSLLSSPTVTVHHGEDGDVRRIYFATGVNAQTNAVVYCLEDRWQEDDR